MRVVGQVQQEANTPNTFDHIVLSSDGKLMAAAVGGSLYLLDAFQGAVKARFSTGRPDQPAGAGFEPSFSPDSQYLSSGPLPASTPLLQRWDACQPRHPRASTEQHCIRLMLCAGVYDGCQLSCFVIQCRDLMA